MPFSLLSTLLLLLTTASAAATSPPPPPHPTTKLGVTYTPSPNLPPPEHVATTLHSLHIPAVRLLDPTPAAVRAFSYTNISLLLTVPNYLIPSFSSNRSAASLWLYTHVLPFHPRAKISLISVGADVISSSSSSFSADSDPSTTLIPAMRNLHLSLRDLGIRTISVSTTFSFINIMTTSFPPSSAEFQEPISSLIIRPLLQFLEETNSSFLVNIYPYNVYKLNSEIPIGYALFQENPFNFRDDVITGVRYRNLFDMMMDAVIAAMAVSGHENIPVIVTETGWPSSGTSSAAAAAATGEVEAEASEIYAEMYLKGLVSHLKSGLGTPLRKEGVAEAYIYELFDDGAENTMKSNNNTSGNGGQHWGILYNNMSMKYKIDFSSSINGISFGFVEILLGLLLVIAVLLL